jgi:hypothetical protein
MSYESDVAGRLNDATLLATLTGGVFQYSSVGLAGITRETAAAAFDTAGFLKPCALVKQRGLIPDGNLQDEMTQQISVRQVVEVWFYTDSGAGWSAIDTAMSRVFTLLYGYTFTGAFPAQLVNVLDRMRDEGALKGACMSRQDWLIVSIFG